jgi:long-chain acyl-CoA synthetase
VAPPAPSGVFDVLRGPLATTPDAPALVTRSARLTYAELDAWADRATGALADLGVRAGDRVAASLPNDAPIVAAFHGAMRLGAIWVGINQALAPPEKAFMLNDCRATVLLSDDPVADGLEATGQEHPARIVRPAEWAAACDAASDAASDASSGRPAGSEPDPEAPAAIAYTSGTTGFPKGAVHCQAGLILPGAATVLRRGWGPDLRKGDALPLTILNMLTLTTLLTAQAGATAVIIDQADVASIVEWIRTERVTVWNGPPAQLWTMVRDGSIDPAHLASLDEVWVGGADCPDRLRMDFEERFGVRVCRTYGLTEAPALVSLDDLDGTAAEGTSGRPLDHVAVDTRDGEIVLGPNPSGPLAGRYRPALGYWEKPDAGVGVLDGRVLRTGDLGQIDPSGHLRVLGRKSTVINRGGANVYPAEVERVLVDAPGVGACSVVGVPDERLGERVSAALEPRAGEVIDIDKVAEYCRANLAAYKVPERWAVVERLPRNQMGKVPAPAVRDLIQASRGSGRP